MYFQENWNSRNFSSYRF